MVGAYAARGTPAFPVGERIRIEGQTVTGTLYRSGLRQRVGDYAAVEGER